MPTTNILDLNNRLEKLEKKPGGAGGDAEDIGYDNSTSHLAADNVQAAIDEVAGDISGLSADDVTYDNTDSGLTADTVQNAIDEVNDDLGDVTDNLNGFKFYPAGTAIVGLVSDDSPYTDANGNYILAASTTGQSMIDDVTYKSINSTEDSRGKVGADTATPFKSGGVKLVDINPEKSTTRSNTNAGYIFGYINNNNEFSKYPCCGYDKIALYRDSSVGHTCKYGFLLSDGTITTLDTLSADAWTNYVQIPNNAIDLLIYYTVVSGATAFSIVISLLAKDSPYNV